MASKAGALIQEVAYELGVDMPSAPASYHTGSFRDRVAVTVRSRVSAVFPFLRGPF